MFIVVLIVLVCSSFLTDHLAVVYVMGPYYCCPLYKTLKFCDPSGPDSQPASFVSSHAGTYEQVSLTGNKKKEERKRL